MARRKGDERWNTFRRKSPKDHTLLGICVMYCGTGYRGLQLQTKEPTHNTVEGVLIQAVKDIGLVETIERGCLKGDAHFSRACRTDRGVHAVRNIISLFVSNERLEALGGYERLKELLNDALPPTIRVAKVSLLIKNFVPRFCCTQRTYRYLIPAYALLAPCDTWEMFHEKFPQAAESLRSLARAGSFFDLCPEETEPWRAALSAAVTRGTDVLQRFVGICRFHNFTVDLLHRDGCMFNRKMVLPQSNEAVRNVHRCEIASRVFLLPKSAMGVTRREYYAALEVVKGDASTATTSLLTSPATAAEANPEGDYVSNDNVLPFVVFQIEGNSFLFNMIRKIVGVLLAVVRGARETLLEEALSPQRRVTCPLAPGPYLYLFLSSYYQYDASVRAGRSTRFHPIAEEWRGDVLEAVNAFATSSIAADVVDIDLNRVPPLNTLLAARDAARAVTRPCGRAEDVHIAPLPECRPAAAERPPVCSEMTSFLRSLRVHNWSVEVLRPPSGAKTPTTDKSCGNEEDAKSAKNACGDRTDNHDGHRHDKSQKRGREEDMNVVEQNFHATIKHSEEMSNDENVGNALLGAQPSSCGDSNDRNDEVAGDDENDEDDGWIYVAPTEELMRCKRREYQQKRKERFRNWECKSTWREKGAGNGDSE